MKKFYITLFSLAAFTLGANAQATLTPAGVYYQNFNGIATGLPVGWFVSDNATSASNGTAGTFYNGATGTYYDTTDCASDIFGHGFKNSASADSTGKANAMLTCAQQVAITNRALSTRQTGSTGDGDPGASFQFELANTTGYKSFNLAFRLQGLDILCGRSVTWTVDYGKGASPTVFTPVTPTIGYMTVGANKFTDTNVIVSFGSALDTSSLPVWIRISALSKSSGSGNRTTTAIDDFTLTYTPLGVENLQANQVDFKVLGAATSNNVTFGCKVAEAGQYTLGMYDITGRQVYTKQVNLTPGTQNNLSVEYASLALGMYIARVYNATTSGLVKVIVQ